MNNIFQQEQSSTKQAQRKQRVILLCLFFLMFHLLIQCMPSMFIMCSLQTNHIISPCYKLIILSPLVASQSYYLPWYNQYIISLVSYLVYDLLG